MGQTYTSFMQKHDVPWQEKMQAEDEEEEGSAAAPSAAAAPAVGSRPSYAFTAAFAILLVAFTNPSLTGDGPYIFSRLAGNPAVSRYSMHACDRSAHTRC